MVDRFCTTPSGLEVVVVVVASDDDEGGGVTTGAGGRRCAIFDCGGGFPGGGRSACRANTDANAPTEMIAHDFQFYIFLILQKTR